MNENAPVATRTVRGLVKKARYVADLEDVQNVSPDLGVDAFALSTVAEAASTYGHFRNIRLSINALLAQLRAAGVMESSPP